MTLTPEQFNKLALKSDLDKNTEEINIISKKMDKMLDALDSMAKNLENRKAEDASNQAAHDRIQADINEIRTHAGLKIKNPVLGDA